MYLSFTKYHGVCKRVQKINKYMYVLGETAPKLSLPRDVAKKNYRKQAHL